MKKSGNAEHRIQLKKDEIERYKVTIKNYPPDRLEKFGKPFLKRLQDELAQLQSLQHETHD